MSTDWQVLLALHATNHKGKSTTLACSQTSLPFQEQGSGNKVIEPNFQSRDNFHWI